MMKISCSSSCRLRQNIGVPFLIAKRVHFSLGNNECPWAANTLQRGGPRYQQKCLFIRIFIVHVQPLNVLLPRRFFAQDRFGLKGTQPPRFPWHFVLFNFCYTFKDQPTLHAPEKLLLKMLASSLIVKLVWNFSSATSQKNLLLSTFLRWWNYPSTPTVNVCSPRWLTVFFLFA